MLKDLAANQKNQFFNGLGMLVEQAAECFKLWFDKEPAVEDVKNKLNEGI
jgi:shikimate 5-dehydrogenase